MEERLNAIITLLNHQLPTGYTYASLEEISIGKIVRKGILCHHKTNASPIFYVDMLPDLNLISNQEAVNYILKVLLISNPTDIKPLVELVTELSEETKKHLTLRVINKSHLNELPEHVSYFTVRETSDLICYLVVELWIDDISEVVSVTVTHDLLTAWNLTINDEKTLIDLAIQNIQANVKVTPMTELLIANSLKITQEDCEMPIFIVTNSLGTNGANIIFANSPFNSICRDFGNDGVILLPSSIHELLAIPYNKPSDKLIRSFTQIIREVNTEQLQPNEILSDHPYYYDYNTEKVISLFYRR